MCYNLSCVNSNNNFTIYYNGGIKMKISFSTGACSGFSWPDVYSMAKDFGYDGMELRSHGQVADMMF